MRSSVGVIAKPPIRKLARDLGVDLSQLVGGGAGGAGGTVWLDLPEVPLPDWVAGITLLGPVTQESVLAGLYDGLRLATLLICVGAANALANPKRLLRSLPPALYEVGTAVVVPAALVEGVVEAIAKAARTDKIGDGKVFVLDVESALRSRTGETDTAAI